MDFTAVFRNFLAAQTYGSKKYIIYHRLPAWDHREGLLTSIYLHTTRSHYGGAMLTSLIFECVKNKVEKILSND